MQHWDKPYSDKARSNSLSFIPCSVFTPVPSCAGGRDLSCYSLSHGIYSCSYLLASGKKIYICTIYTASLLIWKWLHWHRHSNFLKQYFQDHASFLKFTWVLKNRNSSVTSLSSLGVLYLLGVHLRQVDLFSFSFLPVSMMKSTWNPAKHLTISYHYKTDQHISEAWLPDVSSSQKSWQL